MVGGRSETGVAVGARVGVTVDVCCGDEGAVDGDGSALSGVGLGEGMSADFALATTVVGTLGTDVAIRPGARDSSEGVKDWSAGAMDEPHPAPKRRAMPEPIVIMDAFR